MASKPHSGRSILADTRCIATISLNLSVLFVSDKPCLYPKVGRQVADIPLKHSTSQKQWFDNKILTNTRWLSWKFPSRAHMQHGAVFNTVYLQGLASSSSVILMKGSVGFSTNDPKPIRNLLVRLAISLDKEEPRSLIFCRSSNMDADRSIR